MDSIGDLLSGYKMAAPDEIGVIKEYISKEFGVDVAVGMQGEAFVITANSASLANVLRLRQIAIQRAANTTKRLIFRIG